MTGIRWAGIVPAAVVVIVALICAALVGAVVVRDGRNRAESDHVALQYTTPPVGPSTSPSPSATLSTGGAQPGALKAGQTLSIISDRYVLPSAGRTRSWSTTIADALRVNTPVQSAAGYVTGPGGAPAASSYAARAGQVSPASSVVIFAGGAADADASPTELAIAASQAFAAASERAPSARLLVIGPVHTGGEAPSALLSARNAIRAAALAAGAQWNDPIGGDWFAGTAGATLEDDLTISESAQPVIASRLQAALRRLR